MDGYFGWIDGWISHLSIGHIKIYHNVCIFTFSKINTKLHAPWSIFTSTSHIIAVWASFIVHTNSHIPFIAINKILRWKCTQFLYTLALFLLLFLLLVFLGKTIVALVPYLILKCEINIKCFELFRCKIFAWI